MSRRRPAERSFLRIVPVRRGAVITTPPPSGCDRKGGAAERRARPSTSGRGLRRHRPPRLPRGPAGSRAGPAGLSAGADHRRTPTSSPRGARHNRRKRRAAGVRRGVQAINRASCAGPGGRPSCPTVAPGRAGQAPGPGRGGIECGRTVRRLTAAGAARVLVAGILVPDLPSGAAPRWRRGCRPTRAGNLGTISAPRRLGATASSPRARRPLLRPWQTVRQSASSLFRSGGPGRPATGCRLVATWRTDAPSPSTPSTRGCSCAGHVLATAVLLSKRTGLACLWSTADVTSLSRWPGPAPQRGRRARDRPPR